MPDADHVAAATAKHFRPDVAAPDQRFFVKGADNFDWGLKNRLARIFRPATGRTVMLAVDHGYFQGPTTGLERIDLDIVPLLPDVDALMCTRGALRSMIPPSNRSPVVLRASGGPSILKELSDERIAVDIDDAVRLGVAAMAVQVFIGGVHETESVHNMTRLVDSGMRHGIPVMAVVAVGKELTRDAKYFRLACRMCAELGAQFVKAYHVDEEFSSVIASCPVPIVIAGGKKLSEHDALRMAHAAVTEGAAGVDMGRNIFQSDVPGAMVKAVGGVVHDGLDADEAFDLYQTLRHEQFAVV